MGKMTFCVAGRGIYFPAELSSLEIHFEDYGNEIMSSPLQTALLL